MLNRPRQKFDVPESCPSSINRRDLHATTVANHAIVFRAIVFATRTTIINKRSKNTLVSQRPDIIIRRCGIRDAMGDLTE